MLKRFGFAPPLILATVMVVAKPSTAQDRWQAPPIGSVQITPSSPIADGLEVNRKVLSEIGVDRALLAFRVQAGLSTQDAKPLGGWAGPEPYGPFPGFFESHFLSAISLQSVHDPELVPWVHKMVAGLAECQRAMGGQYLFASPEEEFNPDRLDGVVWYRMHKLLEGLIAAHRYAKSEEALQIAITLAEWIEGRVKQYEEDFSKVKKIEYGGMTEALANLYEITGRESFRLLALQWEEPERILKRFANGLDFNEHANTLLAKMVGAARLADLCNWWHKRARRDAGDATPGRYRLAHASRDLRVLQPHEGHKQSLSNYWRDKVHRILRAIVMERDLGKPRSPKRIQNVLSATGFEFDQRLSLQ